MNNDCKVDISDFALIADLWMAQTPVLWFDQEKGMNLGDLQIFTGNWLNEGSIPIISEFLASNGNLNFDEDGDSPDWIEIFNPTGIPVNLNGWYLTDDPLNLKKWQFPDVALDPGQYLVVFASSKNRRDPDNQLHTNFGLNIDGEYLALVEADGMTIASSFEPEYPIQYENISYGFSHGTNIVKLAARRSEAKLFVPTVQGELSPDWISPDFIDDNWTDTVIGVGFDTSVGSNPQVSNVALGKPTSQSSTGFNYGSELAVDGLTGNFTHTLNTDNNATWQVDLQGQYFITKIILTNRGNCCQSRLRDITVTIRDSEDTVDLFASDLLNPENILQSPGFITIDLLNLIGSAVPGGIVKVHRTPDPDLSGNDGVGNADEAVVLSLAEVRVMASELPNEYSALIETDIFDEMINRNASAFLRIPLSLPDEMNSSTLSMNIRYDDGFVAYLNGTKVASKNAPEDVVWNSSALTERPKEETLISETINLTGYRHLFREGANVLAIQGLNYDADDEDFLIDAELTAIDNLLGGLYYMKETSPGKLNNEGLPGVVADTKFSYDRGFYDQPFNLDITTDTPGATIVYTKNNSEPTLDNGTKIFAPDAQTTPTGSVLISKTTILRAAAFKDDYLPTNIDTQTYIFLDDVISSSVMNTSITQDSRYKPQMRNALTDLPTVSIVDPSLRLEQKVVTGPYPNWTYDEFPISIEWLTPDGSLTFQEDVGAARYGGHWYDRSGATYPFEKWSYRIAFRGEYGARQLKAPLFEGFDNGIPPAETFDQLELRSGSHDMYQRGFYMSGALTADTMLEMGNLNPHSRFVHVYINGTYWGQYNLHERWNAGMVSRYEGGEKEDFVAIKANNNGGDFHDIFEAYDGDGTVWENVLTLKNSYEQVKTWVDIQSYVDFMLMFMFGNSESEYRSVGANSEDGVGFLFWLRDPDGFTRSVGDRTSNEGPGNIFGGLISEAHPDFMTFLADRIHKHFFNGGGLTETAMTRKLLERCEQIDVAFYAEAARWGYRTPDAWASARDNYINNILANSPQTLLDRLISRGLYPDVDAPVFRIDGIYQHGGHVLNDAVLSMNSSGGVSYTDVVYVEEGDSVRVHIPTDDSLGSSWTDANYTPDEAWTDGSTGTGVGYETSSGYQTWIDTNVVNEMRGVSQSVFCRLEFEYTDNANIEKLELQMKYDDGFIAYLNGTEVTDSRNITNSTPGSEVTGSHEAASTYEKFDITQHKDLLVDGTNVLAIHGINISLTSSDMIVLPRLVAKIPDDVAGGDPIWYTTDGTDPRLPGGAKKADAIQYEGPLALTQSVQIKARTYRNSEWSALNEATYAVGLVKENLRVTELMYHTSDPNEEFIELKNIGTETINLNLVRLTKGVDFTFPSIELAANEYVLVVKNEECFRLRYPDFTSAIAGQYEGSLDNGGEKVRLRDALHEIIAEFTYNDTWHDITDGGGFSLTIIDPFDSDPLTWDSKWGWRSSAVIGGSPGYDDAGEVPELGSILINEVLAHSHGDLPDWIELHNITDSVINIGGWFLSDSDADDPNKMKYEINEGTTISAGGYIIFSQSTHFGETATGPGIRHIPFGLSEGGDMVHLQSAQAGVLTGYTATEDFGASESGISFGRHVKSALDGDVNFVAMSAKTPWQANAYPKVGPVIITEIMYNPPGSGDDTEYIELHNIENVDVMLTDIVSTETSPGVLIEELVSWQFSDGIEFTFPPMTIIPAGGYLIVAKDRQAFLDEYAPLPQGVDILQWNAGGLANNGERIQIVRPDDKEFGQDRYWIRLDRVNYEDDYPWPAEPDGDGKSLSQKTPDTAGANYGNDVFNWEITDPNPGG